MANTFEVRKEPTGNTKSSTLDASGYILQTFTETYNILIDVNNGDDAETVQSGAQSSGTPSRLPIEGDSHPNKPNATVDSVKTDQLSVLYFKAVVTYKTPSVPSGGGGGGGDQQPWEIPTKFRKMTTYVDREVDHDYDGTPLRNPRTGEPYSIMVQQADFGLQLNKAVLSLEFLKWQSYEDKVSTDPFLGFGPGQAYIQKVEAETASHEGIAYWNLTAIILFRNPVGDDDAKKVWYRKIQRKGLYAMTTGSSPRRARIGLDGDGEYAPYPAQAQERVQYMVPLNEDDEVLLDGEEPVFDFVKVKGETAFSNLGFT